MKTKIVALGLVAVFALTAAACADPAPATEASQTEAQTNAPSQPVSLDTEPTAAADTAIFAGGCFWCMEPPYEKLDGVFSVVSGFAGGTTPDPTYKQVSSGQTDHAEVVRVIYDPEVVSFETLVEVFWHNIDPFAVDRQFCDRGAQYRSVLYYRDAEQQAVAEASYETLDARFDEQIATTVEPVSDFYPAEDYHQDFYRTNPDRYYSYRKGCGRDARLEAIWGDAAGEPGPLG
ncbi:MAG: peptide-methionine (S)-S-oxide reductase MsrA [Rhodothermales bacterium]